MTVFFIDHPVYTYYFGPSDTFRTEAIRHDETNRGAAFFIPKEKLSDPVRQSLERVGKHIWSSDGEVAFRCVHAWSGDRKRCIYVMQYNMTIPASSVTWKNWMEWGCNISYVQIEDIFPSIRDPFPPLYNSLAHLFKYSVEKYKKVLPSDIVNPVFTCFEAHLQQADEMLAATNYKDAHHYVKRCKTETSELVKQLRIEKERYEVPCKKEVQRSLICYELMKQPLDDLGYIVKDTTDSNTVCLFGKSNMDMLFYKNKVSTINAALIKGVDNDEGEGGCGVIGGVTEFKTQSSHMKSHYPQIFADMVKLTTLRVMDVLETGIVIDKVEIYGLLIDQSSTYSRVMKYCMNFCSNESRFYVCNHDQHCSDAFVSVIKRLDELSK